MLPILCFLYFLKYKTKCVPRFCDPPCHRNTPIIKARSFECSILFLADKPSCKQVYSKHNFRKGVYIPNKSIESRMSIRIQKYNASTVPGPPCVPLWSQFLIFQIVIFGLCLANKIYKRVFISRLQKNRQRKIYSNPVLRPF